MVAHTSVQRTQRDWLLAALSQMEHASKHMLNTKLNLPKDLRARLELTDGTLHRARYALIQIIHEVMTRGID